MESSSTQYLLEELRIVSSEFERLRAEGVSRLNFLIALSTSVFGGLIVLLASNSLARITKELIGIVALGSLFLLGVVTWSFMLSRDRNTDLNIRACARIRQYFIERDPPIATHLSWSIHDEPSEWIVNNTSHLRRTTQGIVAVVAGCFFGSLLLASGEELSLRSIISVQEATLVGLSLAVSVVSMLLAFFGMEVRSATYFRRAARHVGRDVRFPKGRSAAGELSRCDQCHRLLD